MKWRAKLFTLYSPLFTAAVLLLWSGPAHAAGLHCTVVQVASTPTTVLPAHARRSALLLQNFAPTNIRCTDGSVQQPMVSGVDPDCPMGVGFAVSPVEPAVSVSGQPGYYGVIQFTGPGTPTGPIVCVHRVTGALRALVVCEGKP